MIDVGGRVRVMDFGLARRIDTSQPETARDGDDSTVRSHHGKSATHDMLTRAGALMGTPAYMAPEQFEGSEVDARTDQFGWCVSLWEALYGERPFAGDDLIGLCAAVTQGRRRPVPRSGSVPRWLRRVVERGLSGDPEARWPALPALLNAIDQGRRRARTIRAVGFVAIAGAGAGSIFGWEHLQKQRQIAECDDKGAKIDTVWNDDERAELRKDLLATGAFIGEASQSTTEGVVARSRVSNTHHPLPPRERQGIDANVVCAMGSDFGRTNEYNTRQGKNHWQFTSMMLMGYGIEGNRTVGATDSSQYAMAVDPNTLQLSDDGVILRPYHVHAALRELAEVSPELDARYPLGEPLPGGLLGVV